MIWDDKSIAFLRDASAATKVGESLKKRGRILNKGYVYLCRIFKYFEVALVTGSELVALIANGNLLINHVCFRELTEVCLFSLPQKKWYVFKPSNSSAVSHTIRSPGIIFIAWRVR